MAIHETRLPMSALIHAAKLLEQEAEILKEAHVLAGTDIWAPDELYAKKAHDELIEAAADLRLLAGSGK